MFATTVSLRVCYTNLFVGLLLTEHNGQAGVREEMYVT